MRGNCSEAGLEKAEMFYTARGIWSCEAFYLFIGLQVSYNYKLNGFLYHNHYSDKVKVWWVILDIFCVKNSRICSIWDFLCSVFTYCAEFVGNAMSFNYFSYHTLFLGVSGVSEGKLLPGGERLSLCPPCRQHHDRHQWQHRHRVHGLHQGSVLPGKVQVLPPAGTPAGQN